MKDSFDNCLPQGAVLRGKAHEYQIERVLGQGSFGITYLASVKIEGALGAIDASVAVKEFFMKDINGRTGTSVTSGSQHGLCEDYKRKFVREARNLSLLRHPNIVRVVEAFEANGTVYYAMEYINGGSLDDYILRHGRLSEQETVRLAREICSALGFMHKNSMLHLDLKPLNIMLRKGEAVLIDFGLSKQYDENGDPESSTKVGGGTPGYAPLEQASYRDGKGFPVTMDIYALGATIYKMLTGRRPPEAADILNDGFPSGELRKAGVSPWLVSLVKQCMSTTRKDRPQSADEVLEELNRHAPTGEETMLGDGEPIVAEVVEALVVEPEPLAPKQEAVPVAEKKSGKSHATAISIAVACLVAIGIVAAFLLSRKPTPSGEELALADTVAVDTMVIPDKLVSEVVEPEEETVEPAKTEVEEIIVPAATQESQTAQQGKPTTGTINGHGYVDLGLSVKWATCNVGASSPEGYGNYYAWGETTTKSSYDDDNCKTWEVSMGSIAGNSSYDAARSNWGGTWRLPTANEIDELINKCQRTWTTM
ncbi:MAG: serine/threonine protein kinase, partial [Prevotellaceae bacterium]|nr:serine/threonine protein kinase [Prevotellaceae bacterium]